MRTRPIYPPGASNRSPHQTTRLVNLCPSPTPDDLGTPADERPGWRCGGIGRRSKGEGVGTKALPTRRMSGRRLTNFLVADFRKSGDGRGPTARNALWYCAMVEGEEGTIGSQQPQWQLHSLLRPPLLIISRRFLGQRLPEVGRRWSRRQQRVWAPWYYSMMKVRESRRLGHATPDQAWRVIAVLGKVKALVQVL